eukprot:scaffold70433_cov27-Tisochrysis_lutea.AAC.2
MSYSFGLFNSEKAVFSRSTSFCAMHLQNRLSPPVKHDGHSRSNEGLAVGKLAGSEVSPKTAKLSCRVAGLQAAHNVVKSCACRERPFAVARNRARRTPVPIAVSAIRAWAKLELVAVAEAYLDGVDCTDGRDSEFARWLALDVAVRCDNGREPLAPLAIEQAVLLVYVFAEVAVKILDEDLGLTATKGTDGTAPKARLSRHRAQGVADALARRAVANGCAREPRAHQAPPRRPHTRAPCLRDGRSARRASGLSIEATRVHDDGWVAANVVAVIARTGNVSENHIEPEKLDEFAGNVVVGRVAFRRDVDKGCRKVGHALVLAATEEWPAARIARLTVAV